MAFPGGRYRSSSATAPARGRSPLVVFAVGRRVFVESTAAQMPRVTLTDDSGAAARGSLRHGTEVEIMAWRPHGPLGTRYLVRASSKGVEGWLGAADIRGAKPKPAVASSGKAAR